MKRVTRCNEMLASVLNFCRSKYAFQSKQTYSYSYLHTEFRYIYTYIYKLYKRRRSLTTTIGHGVLRSDPCKEVNLGLLHQIYVSRILKQAPYPRSNKDVSPLRTDILILG